MPGYILVLPLPAKTKTDGGLEIPTAAQVVPNAGVILRTGGELVKIEGQDNLIKCPSGPLKPGLTVYYQGYAGLGLTDEDDPGKTYLILAVEDVIAYRETTHE